jgi:hypothetical protein
MSSKQDELRDKWRERERDLAELSPDETEAAWLGEARTALRRGDSFGLGFCIQKLRDATPVLYEVAQLLCGHSDDWNVTLTRKRRGNPKEKGETEIEHYLLGAKIDAAEGGNFKRRIHNAGVARRTAFRAAKKFHKPKP